MFTGMNSPEPPVFTHVFHFAVRRKEYPAATKIQHSCTLLTSTTSALSTCVEKIYHGKYLSSQWFLGSKPITTFTTKFVLSVGPAF